MLSEYDFPYPGIILKFICVEKKKLKKKIFCISETGDNVDIVVIIGIVFVIV